MKSTRSVLVLALVLLAGSLPAKAADLPVKAVAAKPPAPSGWTFYFTPYLWAAGLKGDVALGPLVPPVSVDLSFGDIFDHLKMAFMGTFEARKDRFGFIADIDYIRLKASATGPLGFVNARLDDRTFFSTVLGAYRLVDQGTAWVDVTGGGRVWWLQTQLDITAPGPTALSVTREKSWIDPLVGLRARAYLTQKVYVQFDGDVGGFGVGAKSTWQVAGILGYQHSATTSFFAGYRHLSVDYNRNGFVWDVEMSGPVVGASFKF